jgi:hypothetical protein
MQCAQLSARPGGIFSHRSFTGVFEIAWIVSLQTNNTMNRELGRMWKEAKVAYYVIISNIRLVGMKEITKNVSVRHLGKEFKQALTEIQ